MVETEQDQINFVTTAADGRRFFLSVPAGEGHSRLEAIREEGRQWIEVDDGRWINRDHVLYAYASAAKDATF